MRVSAGVIASFGMFGIVKSVVIVRAGMIVVAERIVAVVVSMGLIVSVGVGMIVIVIVIGRMGTIQRMPLSAGVGVTVQVGRIVAVAHGRVTAATAGRAHQPTSTARTLSSRPASTSRFALPHRHRS